MRNGTKPFASRAPIWRVLFAACALAWCGVSQAAAQIQVRAEVNRNRVYIGESFLLYVRVSGAEDGLEPDVKDGGVATVAPAGSQNTSSTYIQIINGRMSEVRNLGRVFVYNVRPNAAGTCRLPTVRVRHAGKWYEATVPPVEVTGVEAQDFVHVALSATATEILLDQPFTVSLEIRIRALEGQYAQHEPILSGGAPHLAADYLDFQLPKGLDGPDANAVLAPLATHGNGAGFSINHFRRQGMPGFGGFPGFGAMPNFDDMFAERPIVFRFAHRTETRNNVLWHVYTLATDYVAREEGDYVFGPVTFKGGIISGVAIQHGRANAVPRDVFTVGPALVVRVVPPPEEGRPANFYGGVGASMAVRTELDAAVCKMGDPLTLTLDVTGGVNARNLRPPRLSGLPGIDGVFRVYDESVEGSALEKGRRFTYRVRPLTSGTIEFPAVELSFYNTTARHYEAVRSAPIPLQVQATAQLVAEGAAEAVPDAAEGWRADGQDRLPSGITLSRWQRPGLATRGGFWLLLCGGPAVFVLLVAGGWVLPRMRKATVRFTAWQRSRHCHGGVRRARDAAALEHAFRDYLSGRLKVAGRSVTPREAGEAARPFGEALGVEARGLLECLAEAVYRPGAATDIEGLRGELVQFIEKLDAAVRAHRRGKNAAHHLPLLLLVFGAAMSHAEPAREFEWNQANARMASAETREDYLDAARLYDGLLRNGATDGGVMLNLGAALLMAGEPEAAYEAYVRAERRLGHTVPGLSRDITTALRMVRDEPALERPWPRVLFFWHYALPMDQRILWGLYGWAGLWAALVFRRFTRRVRGRGRGVCEAVYAALCVVSVVVVVAFGVSGLLSAIQECSSRGAGPLALVAETAGEKEPGAPGPQARDGF